MRTEVLTTNYYYGDAFTAELSTLRQAQDKLSTINRSRAGTLALSTINSQLF
ncbi:MAG: hypothetical protein ACRC62_23040 [Microcoleus sp.]